MRLWKVPAGFTAISASLEPSLANNCIPLTHRPTRGGRPFRPPSPFCLGQLTTTCGCHTSRTFHGNSIPPPPRDPPTHTRLPAASPPPRHEGPPPHRPVLAVPRPVPRRPPGGPAVAGALRPDDDVPGRGLSWWNGSSGGGVCCGRRERGVHFSSRLFCI